MLRALLGSPTVSTCPATGTRGVHCTSGKTSGGYLQRWEGPSSKTPAGLRQLCLLLRQHTFVGSAFLVESIAKSLEEHGRLHHLQRKCISIAVFDPDSFGPFPAVLEIIPASYTGPTYRYKGHHGRAIKVIEGHLHEAGPGQIAWSTCDCPAVRTNGNSVSPFVLVLHLFDDESGRVPDNTDFMWAPNASTDEREPSAKNFDFINVMVQQKLLAAQADALSSYIYAAKAQGTMDLLRSVHTLISVVDIDELSREPKFRTPAATRVVTQTVRDCTGPTSDERSPVTLQSLLDEWEVSMDLVICPERQTTPLHRACEFENWDAAKILLGRDANRFARSNEQKVPDLEWYYKEQARALAKEQEQTDSSIHVWSMMMRDFHQEDQMTPHKYYCDPGQASGQPPQQVQQQSGSGPSWRRPDGVDVPIPEGFLTIRVKEPWEGDVRSFIVEALDYTLTTVKQNILFPGIDVQTSFLAVVSSYDRSVVTAAWDYFCKHKHHIKPIRVKWTEYSSASDYAGSVSV